MGFYFYFNHIALRHSRLRKYHVGIWKNFCVFRKIFVGVLKKSVFLRRQTKRKTTMTVTDIILASKRPRRDIAEEVFPEHTNPLRTLKRVESGEQQLKVDELLQLCRSCNVSALDVVSDWRTSREDAKLVFTKGPIRAEIDGVSVKIFRNGELVAEEDSDKLPGSYIWELEQALNTFIK